MKNEVIRKRDPVREVSVDPSHQLSDLVETCAQLKLRDEAGPNHLFCSEPHVSCFEPRAVLSCFDFRAPELCV